VDRHKEKGKAWVRLEPRLHLLAFVHAQIVKDERECDEWKTGFSLHLGQKGDELCLPLPSFRASIDFTSPRIKAANKVEGSCSFVRAPSELASQIEWEVLHAGEDEVADWSFHQHTGPSPMRRVAGVEINDLFEPVANGDREGLWPRAKDDISTLGACAAFADPSMLDNPSSKTSRGDIILWLSAKPSRSHFAEQVSEIVDLYTRTLASWRWSCVLMKRPICNLVLACMHTSTRSGLPTRLEHESNESRSPPLVWPPLIRGTGKVYARTERRKRQTEFIASGPDGERNPSSFVTSLSSLTIERAQRQGRCKRAPISPRFAFFFVPVHCSWMNQVEQWFIQERKRLRISDFSILLISPSGS